MQSLCPWRGRICNHIPCAKLAYMQIIDDLLVLPFGLFLTEVVYEENQFTG
jgi:hypothetical protein